MTSWTYEKGLHDLGGGAWAYLQPDGGWGWSNAGLITDGEEALLVDTLFDERLTAEMLDVMARDTGFAAADIATLVNTHANGDHTYGNRLVERAEIIASEAGAREMAEVPPEMLAQMMQTAKVAGDQMGALGPYLVACFSAFDFAGVQMRLPTSTFTGEMTRTVGDKTVHLIEVGPAHTAGDTLVHVPADRVVYTGDILFIEGTPIMWQGPVSNWLRACDRILAMDVEAIVPGHGPITDKAGVVRVKDYLEFVDAEARQRFDAGMDAAEAAKDIALGEFRHWRDAERIAVNVDTLYREYRGELDHDHGDSHGHQPPDVIRLFTLMAEIARSM